MPYLGWCPTEGLCSWTSRAGPSRAHSTRDDTKYPAAAASWSHRAGQAPEAPARHTRGDSQGPRQRQKTPDKCPWGPLHTGGRNGRRREQQRRGLQKQEQRNGCEAAAGLPAMKGGPQPQRAARSQVPPSQAARGQRLGEAGLGHLSPPWDIPEGHSSPVFPGQLACMAAPFLPTHPHFIPRCLPKNHPASRKLVGDHYV